VVCEALVDDAAQPSLVQLREVDACDHRPPARAYELTKEEVRRLAPDRLNVLKPGSGDAVFIPRPNIGEVNVAEDDARKAALSERRKLVAQLRLHLGPGGRDSVETDPDRRCLRSEHLDSGGVEANSPSGRI